MNGVVSFVDIFCRQGSSFIDGGPSFVENQIIWYMESQLISDIVFRARSVWISMINDLEICDVMCIAVLPRQYVKNPVDRIEDHCSILIDGGLGVCM